MRRLRDERHAAERAQVHGLGVDLLSHKTHGGFKAGGVAISPCPVCRVRFDAIVHDLVGGGVDIRCEGCDDPGAITAALLASPDHEERFVLPVLTARELCHLPDGEGDDELVGPILRRGCRTLLGAHTGEGKTTMALQVMAAVTTGGSFLDWECSHPGRVLIVDAEQGLRSIKRKLREAGLDQSDVVDYVSVPDGLELDRDERHIAAIEAQLDAEDYVAVVADPLYKLHAGDSNDERAAVDLMRRFDRWRTEHGWALFIPVHLRKPPAGARFTIHEFFGSTAYTRGPEVVLGLQRVREGYARLYVFKDRDGALPVPSIVNLIYDREHGFRRDPNQDAAKPTAAEQIRQLLIAQPGMSLEQLMAATGYADRTVRKALKELDARGQRQGGSNGVNSWVLPPPTDATRDVEGENP